MLVGALLWCFPGAGGADEAELEAARLEARQAADAFTDTATRLDGLEVELAHTEAAIETTRAHYEQLRAAVGEEAIHQYVRAGSGEVPLVSDDLNTQARASALSRVARGRATGRADEFAAAKAQLDRQQDELTRQRAEAERVRDAQADQQRALYARLAELELIEQRRQESERQAEADRRAAAAAAAQAAYDEAARAAAATPSAAESPGTDRSAATPAAPVPPRPLVPLDWLCPITGAYSFSDTWGQARSGGRSHRGTDIFADYGTPLVAVVDGEAVDYGWDWAGGNGVFLLGDDGNRYYYAHLDDFGSLGRVRQGDVVGYVGDTGNATGTPHLHFEIHPGGSGWTNPYGTLASYC